MLVLMATVATLFCCTYGENPAVQVILTNKGLQYGRHTGANWVQGKLDSITLPDFTGEFKFGFLGKIHYTLTGTRIKKCDLPEPKVEFNPDVGGLKWSLLGLSVALSGQWGAQSAILGSRGTFDLAVFSVDLVSEIKLGRDAGGHLTVTSHRCDARVGDVDVRVRGRFSWIVQRILWRYTTQIKKGIEIRICPHVEKAIVNLDHHLQAMNVSFDVDQDLSVDASLTASPLVNVSSLTLSRKGEFYNRRTGAEPPFEAQPFTLPEKQSHMFAMGLSDFAVKSALYGYYTAGVFAALINELPPEFPLQLNTSSMGPYIPQLPGRFPGLLMYLQVNATEAPTFSFQPDAAYLGLSGAIDVFAIQANGSQPLFQLSIESSFSSTLRISDQKVKGSVQLNNLTLTLVQSEVGNFTTDGLANVTKIGIEGVLANVNKELCEGIVLPRMPHAQLLNSVLMQHEGFIALYSDAEVLWDGFFS